MATICKLISQGFAIRSKSIYQKMIHVYALSLTYICQHIFDNILRCNLSFNRIGQFGLLKHFSLSLSLSLSLPFSHTYYSRIDGTKRFKM